MSRVNIEDALPEKILKLRFNQEVIANKFGTFKNFLKENDLDIGRKRRPDIIKMIEDHYEKFGSSDSDDFDEENARYRSDVSINVTQVSEDDDTDNE